MISALTARSGSCLKLFLVLKLMKTLPVNCLVELLNARRTSMNGCSDVHAGGSRFRFARLRGACGGGAPGQSSSPMRRLALALEVAMSVLTWA